MGGLFSARRLTKEAPPAGTKWHEFVWRNGGKRVILTGAFDNWQIKEDHIMTARPGEGVHKICIPLDPNQAWQFKFVVDGQWRCSLDYPTICDPNGNTNNLLHPE